MNKFTKMLGVTLLEVMLVLAVASIIILTSVRFYKSATESSQVNNALQSIQAVVAAADGLAQGVGTYGSINTGTVTTIVGSSAMTAPWGSPITISAPGATTYTINFTAPPAAVCTQLQAKIVSNPKLSMASCTAVVFTSTAG